MKMLLEKLIVPVTLSLLLSVAEPAEGENDSNNNNNNNNKVYLNCKLLVRT